MAITTSEYYEVVCSLVVHSFIRGHAGEPVDSGRTVGQMNGRKQIEDIARVF